jgi:hypothetical protein
MISSTNGRAAHAGLCKQVSKRVARSSRRGVCLRADWQVVDETLIAEVFDHVCDFCDACL